MAEVVIVVDGEDDMAATTTCDQASESSTYHKRNVSLPRLFPYPQVTFDLFNAQAPPPTSGSTSPVAHFSDTQQSSPSSSPQFISTAATSPRLTVRRTSTVSLINLSPAESASMTEVEVPLVPVPPQILIPFEDRPREMDALMDHNAMFFSNLRNAMALRQWAAMDELWRSSDRRDVPDDQFVARTRRMMADAGCDHLFKPWCDVIGYEHEDFDDDDEQQQQHGKEKESGEDEDVSDGGLSRSRSLECIPEV